jgi:hypothetical protein
MPPLLLHNARIYTLDPAQPRTSALLIDDGKIRAIGADDDLLNATFPPGTTRINAEGRVILPGLTDAHLHFEWYSLGLTLVGAETPTLAECLANVAAFAARAPKGQWIRGSGWNHNVWGGAFPAKDQLDAVAPHHPVLLTAKSGHAAWVNSLALQQCGITAATPDPAGGAIHRDAHGAPTGLLTEDAIHLVTHHIPEATIEALAHAMRLGMEKAWRVGLTGIHDFDRRRSFVALQLLKERGQLGLRVVKQIPVQLLDEAMGLGLRSGFGEAWLRIGNVKVFLDGALGPRTALMIEPYEGEPGNYGISVTDKETLYEYATRAAAHGLAMTVHAIGDKANHDLLDVYEKIREEESQPERRAALRHRCEHVQILRPADFGRLAQLNVIASMQPIHATSDMRMADQYWGARRSAGAYALKTQLEAGAVLAFGSDAPVEDFNPFWGIHAAVTRRRADGTPGPEGWFPEQRLSVLDAVKGFTTGAAYAGYNEHLLGTLTPGKLADLIVIDRDIFTCDSMSIKDTQVLGTLVDGEWKWRNF